MLRYHVNNRCSAASTHEQHEQHAASPHEQHEHQHEQQHEQHAASPQRLSPTEQAQSTHAQETVKDSSVTSPNVHIMVQHNPPKN